MAKQYTFDTDRQIAVSFVNIPEEDEMKKMTIC